MELTEIHKDLITVLKSLNLPTETIVLIMQACEEEKQALEMINYLIDMHEIGTKPTEEMLLKQIVKMGD